MLLIKVLSLQNQYFPLFHCGYETPQVSVPKTFTHSPPPCHSSSPCAVLISAVSLMRKEGVGCHRWGPAH